MSKEYQHREIATILDQDNVVESPEPGDTIIFDLDDRDLRRSKKVIQARYTVRVELTEVAIQEGGTVQFRGVAGHTSVSGSYNIATRKGGVSWWED